MFHVFRDGIEDEAEFFGGGLGGVFLDEAEELDAQGGGGAVDDGLKDLPLAAVIPVDHRAAQIAALGEELQGDLGIAQLAKELLGILQDQLHTLGMIDTTAHPNKKRRKEESSRPQKGGRRKEESSRPQKGGRRKEEVRPGFR